MGTGLGVNPTHTEVAIWGVKPLKKALWYSWAVPVLPATGRSGRAAARPVPPVTTPRSMAVTVAAILGSITLVQFGLRSNSCLPGASILAIEKAGQRTPLLASTP
jgi:hypothetical protein